MLTSSEKNLNANITIGKRAARCFTRWAQKKRRSRKSFKFFFCGHTAVELHIYANSFVCVGCRCLISFASGVSVAQKSDRSDSGQRLVCLNNGGHSKDDLSWRAHRLGKLKGRRERLKGSDCLFTLEEYEVRNFTWVLFKRAPRMDLAWNLMSCIGRGNSHANTVSVKSVTI